MHWQRTVLLNNEAKQNYNTYSDFLLITKMKKWCREVGMNFSINGGGSTKYSYEKRN